MIYSVLLCVEANTTIFSNGSVVAKSILFFLFFFFAKTSYDTLCFFCLISKTLKREEGPNKTCMLQGISYWNVKSNLGLTDRNMLVRLCLKVSVWSWVLDIWLSSSNFQKSNIDWPQQPLTEKMPCISKNLDFWLSIPQKMTIIGHFGAIDDQIIRIRKFFKEMGL